MSSGMFDDLDLESASDNPWVVPPNTYKARVTGFVVRHSQAGNKGLSIEYTVTDGPHTGKTVQEWKGFPQDGDSEETKERAKSYLKQRATSLGIHTFSGVQEDAVLGTPVIVEVKKGKDENYPNVNKVTLDQNPDSTDGLSEFASPTSNPFG